LGNIGIVVANVGGGITFSGSSIELVVFKGEVTFGVSTASGVLLTWRLPWGVRSVSGFGEGVTGSFGIGESSERGETGDGTESTFGCSNAIGRDRGIEEVVGGYEGGPRGAILVYTVQSQPAHTGLALKLKKLTFRKEATTPICQVPPQIPAIAKVVITFD
jgi:hypothetical protein